MNELKWLFRTASGYKKFIIFGLTLTIITAFLGIVNPMVAGQLVKDVIQDRKLQMLIPLLALMVGVSFFKSTIRYGMQTLFEFASQNIFKRHKDELYQKLQSMDFGFMDRNRTGDLMAIITNDTEIIRNFVALILYSIVENLLLFVFAVVMIGLQNWQIMLMLMAISPLIAIATYKFSKKIRPVYARIREQYSRLNTVVEENISGNRVVKAYTKEDYEIEKFEKENTSFRDINIEASKISATFTPILETFSQAIIFTLLISGGLFMYFGKIQPWQFVTINGYMGALINPMKTASNLVNEFQRFIISAGRVMGIMRAEPLVENPEKPVEHVPEGDVEFVNVSFGYPGNKTCLKKVSFKVTKGQTVGIIGSTGAGKTSLISLIPRFYDVREGKVLLDGIDVRDYDLTTLRSKIGIAMQDVFLFSDTVEGNIAFGVPEIPFDNVERAAEASDANDFILKMEDGYDTIVGERGVGLSGGQRQRLSLARSICKNPSILILDDTTSAVDMETERKIQGELSQILSGKTTFIIAQRLSSIKHADLILVVEDGEIVERGNHEQLLEKRGYYYDIYQEQIGEIEEAMKFA
ncbi:MAG: ABC transporter ATP-binding protein/permease [Clostridiales bacterium]|jgi:ATP-binding cassette subfamily B protein|nr:ABC transporter ATP-binding protein/permease [Clostridiales bacterium]